MALLLPCGRNMARASAFPRHVRFLSAATHRVSAQKTHPIFLRLIKIRVNHIRKTPVLKTPFAINNRDVRPMQEKAAKGGSSRAS